MRCRPGTCRIFCRDNEIAPVTEVAVNNVESTVIIADRRSHYAAVTAVLVHVKAVLRCQHIAQLLPVSQISAVKERNSRTQFKTRAHKIVVFSRPADRRIRIKARNNRIFDRMIHCVALLFWLTGKLSKRDRYLWLVLKISKGDRDFCRKSIPGICSHI